MRELGDCCDQPPGDRQDRTAGIAIGVGISFLSCVQTDVKRKDKYLGTTALRNGPPRKVSATGKI